jgi:hypothetical protein
LQRWRSISSFEVSPTKAHPEQGIKQNNCSASVLDRTINDSHSESACIDTGVLPRLCLLQAQHRRPSLLQKLLVALEQQLIHVCLSGAALVATSPMLSAAVVVLLYLPLSACACLGSLYVPALVLILWVSGCRALVVALVGTKRDSFLILAQISAVVAAASD